jgi:alpha-L-fucosidase 2
LLGSMIYMQDKSSLRFEMGRTDVCDHRQGNLSKDISTLLKISRLPIGYFTLKPSGRIITNTARVDLWNAEATGVITTTKGQIHWKATTLSQMNVILVETDFTGSEKDFQWEWHPDTSDCPRNKFQRPDAGYVLNPLFRLKNKGDINYCFQPMLAGGDYTTAWTAHNQNGKKLFYISIGYSHQQNQSVKQALQNINAAKNIPIATLIKIHRNWWHAYYPQSFISMPDKRMESFYWIQQYKLASATRAGSPLIDLMGPWFRSTPWPAYWFNLNLQLTYSPLYTANRMQLARTLNDAIDKNVSNLVNNCPQKYRYNSLALGRTGGGDMISPIEATDSSTVNNAAPLLEAGDATWALYYYWLYYRYTMDKNVM